MERSLAALATVQHGVVAREQLAALGFQPSAVDRRVAAGRLHVIHRGVYAVGHPVLGRDGRWLAAVLACGPGAALSHRSAAELHGFRSADAARIDVVVPRGRPQRHAGIAAHRPTRLAPDEVTEIRHIPVTAAERTLIDLAAVVTRRHLERACDDAERARTVDWSRVVELIERQPSRLGARRLRRVLSTHGIGESRTRSELEGRFLALCALHRMPRPDVNLVIAGYEVDFSWPAPRVVVETDGDEYHRTRVARERDRRRDADLTVAGWRVMRISHHRLDRDRRALVRDLRRLLATPPPSSGSLDADNDVK